MLREVVRIALIAISFAALVAAFPRDLDACGWWGESIGENEDSQVVEPMSSGAGEARAWARQGEDYRLGRGVGQDFGQAAYWYRKAAEAGHPGAMNDLANLYELGRGVPRSDGEAVVWFRRAAEKGDARAQHSLGVRLLSGTGIAADPAAGARWLRQAAEQGHASAFVELAEIYWQGQGVPKDTLEACILWSLAARYGQGEGAETCRGADAEIVKQAREQAERRAAAWGSIAASR